MDEKLLLTPMLHHWRERERVTWHMTRLCFGSLLMYYVANTDAREGSVCVNGQGCSVGVDASKSRKWLYFVIWNSWPKSPRHQWWVSSVWPWDKCDCEVHLQNNLYNVIHTKKKKKKRSADLESLDLLSLILAVSDFLNNNSHDFKLIGANICIFLLIHIKAIAREE